MNHDCIRCSLWLVAAALALFSRGSFAQSEFEGCTRSATSGLVCPGGVTCRASNDGEELQCSTGLRCRAASDSQNLLRCNTGSAYQIAQGRVVLVKPPLPTSGVEPRSELPIQRSPVETRVDGSVPTPPAMRFDSLPTHGSGSSCQRDAAGLIRCSGGLVCQNDVASGLLRCNNGKICSIDGGLVRCSDGSSSRTDAGGLTRSSNGSWSTTDASGLTRNSDGSYCTYDKAAQLKRCYPAR